MNTEKRRSTNTKHDKSDGGKQNEETKQRKEKKDWGYWE